MQILARSGGSGQNGNGINMFPASGVRVEGNRITDSAVSGNAASTILILGNAFQRIGEVALYAEFVFEGAVIANNLVDGAAAGISVTNLNVCGRLAVVHGNLVRNLERREFEQVDKRGEGIAVEADASVIGNIVENALTAGIVIGWGSYMRDVIVSGNLIRDAGVGISISSDTAAGACLVTGNMISGTRDGAIRAMDQGPEHEPDLAREPVATSRRGGRGKNMAVQAIWRLADRGARRRTSVGRSDRDLDGCVQLVEGTLQRRGGADLAGFHAAPGFDGAPRHQPL